MSDFTGDMSADMDLPAPAPETEVVAPVTEKSSIDDAISRAVQSVEARNNGQPRDEVGRFAAKQAAEAAAKAAQTPPGVEQAVSPTVEAQAPASWGKDRAAMFHALPPEAKAYILQREDQISQGFKRYEGLSEYATIAERNGESLRGVLDRVKQLEDGMARDPIGTLTRIGQMYNIDFKALAGQAAANPQAQQPQQQAPQFDIGSEVERVLAVREIKQTTEQFFADPANKYINQVADHVAALLRADAKLGIKDAYERAIWADPQIRAELLQEQATKTQAARVQTAQQPNQAAVRAAKSLVGSTTSPLNGSKGKTIDDAINAAVAAHGY